MDFAFIVDPPHTLKAYKDSSVAMLRAAAKRGHRLWLIEREDLGWSGGLSAEAVAITPTDDDARWFLPGAREPRRLAEFDAVLMRQDPPFDMEYVAATWLLEIAEREGAHIYNRPRAIRDHSEKLALLEFAEFAPPTAVLRAQDAVQSFIAAHGDVVLKPLDGMGGAGVFRVRADDPNRNVIVETLTAQGTRTIMAQRYLPQIAEGDLRVLLIGGEVMPWGLARIPQGGDLRGNLAAGGKGVARELTDAERAVAATLAPVLWQRGLFIVGLDLIGGRVTEINVTSPTCFVEIAEQSGLDVAGHAISALEGACTCAG